MTESEYWDLVYGAARSLVTSYGADRGAWGDILDEFLASEARGERHSVVQQQDILKHGQTKVDPEEIYGLMLDCWDQIRGDWKAVLGFTAGLTMQRDITTAAEKLAANLPPDYVGTAYDQEN